MKAGQCNRFGGPAVLAAEAHRRLEERSVRAGIVLDPTMGSEVDA